MPLFPMYFSPLSPQQANPMLTGMQMGQQAVGQNLANVGTGIRNALMQAQVPYAGQLAQAQAAQAQAQVPYTESQTALNIGTLPWLGAKFYAPLLGAQAKALQAGISNANLYKGLTQTPEGQRALATNPALAQTLYNSLKNSGSLINAGIGGLGQFGQLPQGLVPQGIIPPFSGGAQNPGSYPVLPGGNPNVAPVAGQTISPAQTAELTNLLQPGLDQQTIQNIQNQAALAAQKQVTDPAARQKNLYASNIEKTMQLIDPKALTQYAGATGSAERLGQAGLASIGAESGDYDNYLKSMRAAQLMATQVRQFYGDSIQPSMTARLEAITNPSTWSTNPKLALSLYNQTKNILEKETGTYREAMQSTAPYQAQPTTAQTPQAAAPTPPVTRVLGGRTYTKINGQWYMQ